MRPCAVKICAVHPVFARVVGSCGQQSQANVQGPMKQNARLGEQSEAPRRRWKPGQEQHPGPQNQDSQHMVNQPRGSFQKGIAIHLLFVLQCLACAPLCCDPARLLERGFRASGPKIGKKIGKILGLASPRKEERISRKKRK